MPTSDRMLAVRDRPDDAFPDPRFPAGVTVPPAALLAVLVLAGTGLCLLHSPGAVGVPLGPPDRPGLVPGLLVAGTGVWVAASLWMLVARPVRRLHADVVRGAGRRVRRSGLREVDRVAAAVRPGRSRRGVRLPIDLGLVAVGLGMTGWLLASYVLVTAGQPGPLVGPAADGRLDAAAAAAADVRHGLQDGLAGARATADSVPDPTPAALAEAATQLLAARPLFDGVQVLDPDGTAVATAGAVARIDGPLPAAGLAQLNDTGAAPVVVAVAPVAGSDLALVARYDIRALNDRLRRAGQEVDVLDPGHRLVLSTDGYRAFTPETDPMLLEAVTAAPAGRTAAGEGLVGGTPSTVAVHRVGLGDAAAELGWVVVHSRTLGDAAFSTDATDRAATALLGAAGVGGILVLFWVHVTTVRPLRELGDHAEAVARMIDGGRAPEPLAPQRLDEVGAIAARLNRGLVRAHRLPLEETHVLTVVRGPATEVTTVLPVVVERTPVLR